MTGNFDVTYKRRQGEWTRGKDFPSFLWTKRKMTKEITNKEQNRKTLRQVHEVLFRSTRLTDSSFVQRTQKTLKKDPFWAFFYHLMGGVRRFLEVCDCGLAPPAGEDHALLSLPFVWAASLGTVFTSEGAFFTSVSVSGLLLSSVTILPLEGKREPHKQKERKILLVMNSKALVATVCFNLSFVSFEKKERKTCLSFSGNLFSLEPNVFHT